MWNSLLYRCIIAIEVLNGSIPRLLVALVSVDSSISMAISAPGVIFFALRTLLLLLQFLTFVVQICCLDSSFQKTRKGIVPKLDVEILNL